MSTKPVMDTNSSGRRRNRSWPVTLKREIVAASFAPGSSVSEVARRYDVNANQLFNWRKIHSNLLPARTEPAIPQLVPVVVRPEPPQEASPTGMSLASTAMSTIEIDGVGKYRLRIGRGADMEALSLVLDVLERR